MNLNITYLFKQKQKYQKEYAEVVQDVRKFYFDDNRVGMKTSVEYMTMISDLNFDYANFITIKRHVQESKGKVYALR